MSADRPRRLGRALATLLALGILGPTGLLEAEAEEALARSSNGAGLIQGVVTYEGPLPEPVPVFEAATARPLVEVEAETRGLKEAVVWLEGVPESDQAGDEVRREKPAIMDQENYFFIPHVLTIEAGQQVEFLNSDLANHGITAASLEPANRFNVVTPSGGRYKHRFVASGHPVAIGCPIHGSMAAWIYVFDHRYHAVTNRQGRFRLPAVPPGRYTLQVRHPSGGMRQDREIVVRDGEPLEIRIEFLEDDLRVGR